MFFFLRDLFVSSEEDKATLAMALVHCIVILGKAVFLGLFKWEFSANESNQIIRTNS